MMNVYGDSCEGFKNTLYCMLTKSGITQDFFISESEKWVYINNIVVFLITKTIVFVLID